MHHHHDQFHCLLSCGLFFQLIHTHAHIFMSFILRKKENKKQQTRRMSITNKQTSSSSLSSLSSTMKMNIWNEEKRSKKNGQYLMSASSSSFDDSLNRITSVTTMNEYMNQRERGVDTRQESDEMKLIWQ